MRKLWIIRLNNAVREHGMKYSEFIRALKNNKIELDRKVLSQLAVENPEIFAQFVEKIKSNYN